MTRRVSEIRRYGVRVVESVYPPPQPWPQQWGPEPVYELNRREGARIETDDSMRARLDAAWPDRLKQAELQETADPPQYCADQDVSGRGLRRLTRTQLVVSAEVPAEFASRIDPSLMPAVFWDEPEPAS